MSDGRLSDDTDELYSLADAPNADEIPLGGRGGWLFGFAAALPALIVVGILQFGSRGEEQPAPATTATRTPSVETTTSQAPAVAPTAPATPPPTSLVPTVTPTKAKPSTTEPPGPGTACKPNGRTTTFSGYRYVCRNNVWVRPSGAAPRPTTTTAPTDLPPSEVATPTQPVTTKSTQAATATASVPAGEVSP